MAVARRKGGVSKSQRKTSPSRRRRTRRARANTNGTLSRARDAMARAVTPDVSEMQAEVRQLMHDLEDRIDRLNALTKRGTGHAIDGLSDLVYGAIGGATQRVRDNSRAVSNDAARLSDRAIRQVETQIDRHPLLTLAIAAGIGFVAGLVRRPD